jgi:26S proteasome regulatory subunit N7
MVTKYMQLCDLFGWEKNQTWIAEASQRNEAKLKELDAKIEDAETNFGETEVREANLAKAEHICRVGTKEEAESAYRLTAEKTVSLGQRLDIALALIRIGFYYNDQDLIKRNITKAKSLIEEGGDWDRRNRLKVYEAFHLMSTRNFSGATTLYLEALASFSAEELFEFKTLVYYVVVCGVLSLDRVLLKQKVVDSPEVLSVLSGFPSLERLLTNFFESEYQGFFVGLAEVTEEMKFDQALHPHVSYFSREIRVKSYRQYLSSYSSVKLKSMASAFGVTESFIDSELVRFVSLGKVDCRIDAVGGIITTTRPDTKNAQYSTTVKQGDALLNRIQKLSRVIHL